MKRIFQRRVRSPSASSPSESPTLAHAQTSLLSPRRAASASGKGSAARIGPELTENRAAAVAVSGDALHAHVEVFATSTQVQEQQQALTYLHKALVTDCRPSEGAESLLSARDTNTLVSVGGQRLRSCFSRALELFNAGRLDGNANAKFLLSTDIGERNHVLQLLQVLRVLLVRGDHGQALLLVSARIPSTLVKVVKALSDAGETGSVDELVRVILGVLAVLVTSPDVVQELNESSTLHRIFHLAFREETLQISVVEVVEALVQHLQQSRWRSMVKLLYEERCLIDLTHHANGTGALAKTVLVTAVSMRRAFACGLLDLHREMNAQRQRQKIMSTFTQLFELRQHAICADDTAPATAEALYMHDQELADAVADLCLSGNEHPIQRSNLHENKAFQLATVSMGNVVGQSLFNSEAFGLLSDIIAYLHRPTNTEEEHRWYKEICAKMMDDRERLECRYLQKLGQIVVTSRFDYEFVSNTSFLARAIENLDGYSEIAQHTIMSVLSAIAIEARVIPYVELVSMNAFIQKVDTLQKHSIDAILAFIANLLRFDESYHEVLFSVGLVSTLVALFLDQTSTVCPDAGSTQIRVEYPTRSTSTSQTSGTPDESTGINEQSIISMLASHCHQRARRRRQCGDAMRRADYIILIDIMKLVADGVQSHTTTRDKQYCERTLCGLPTLECVCTLAGSTTFQQEGTSLWISIVTLSLRVGHDDAILRNVVNSFLQALRYVTLAIYFPKDGEVTLAFPGDVAVLQGGLTYLEALLRPKSVAMTAGVSSGQGICFDKTPQRERFLKALLDCDALISLLGIICAVTKKWEVSIDDTNTCDVLPASFTAVTLSLRSIFSIVTTSSEAEQQFCRLLSFGSFGDLIGNFLAKADDTLPADDAIVPCAISRVYFSVSYCIGFSLGDFALISFDKPARLTANHEKDRICPGVLRYPQLFGIGVQILSLHASKLGGDLTHQLLNAFLRIATFPNNADRLASVNALEVLLRSFTAKPASSSEISAPEEGKLSQALLWESNPFHELVVALVESVAIASVSLTAADYWVKMLLCLCRDRSLQSRKAIKRERVRSIVPRSADSQPRDENATASTTTPVSSLLRLLVKLTSATFERTEGAPAVAFDVSKDGFGCLQIPDINVRVISPVEATSATSPSLPSFSHNSKIWPPPDGYSVMVWFRVESFERKDEREKLYRECFLSNTCIHCGGKVQDEYVLKCSHRACRGCIEALLNCGGECAVCNPPIFYLFRLRSIDGKSVTEAFIKGGKLYMRTSSSRASVYQFTHTPINTREWHHVVFTHAKQRFQSSMVSCYLNGILQENVKISYPSSITGSQPVSGLVGIPSQARRCSSVKWILGPWYLLDLPISAPVVNAVFAAGPSYDKLYSGVAGNNEIGVTYDHLRIPNMVMLDSYMWDPVRSLIDSVDVERGGRNKLLRRSLSLASAASSTAAAIVQDIKSSANVFARIPTSVPMIHIPVPSERIVVAYSARNAVEKELTIIPSSKLDGRPSGHLMGGTTLRKAATMVDAMFSISNSGCHFAFGLLDEASTKEEVELALEFLWLCMQSNARNLVGMENDHGYGIVNYLLHEKAQYLTPKCLQVLFRMVGVDIELVKAQVQREGAIRNMQALQYFILDYSLWQKAPGTVTAKLLFSTLYSCLAADDESTRERNRTQLQSVGFVRQLLYVLMDPTVTIDILRVIVDVVLVCLTSPTRESTLESNFADVTSFLAGTLSPRFGCRGREVSEEEISVQRELDVNGGFCDAEMFDAIEVKPEFTKYTLASPTGRLCLSPRGSRRLDVTLWDVNVQHGEKANSGQPKPSARFAVHQANVQELLLEALLKAVQKFDVKENKDHGDDYDGSVPDTAVIGESKAITMATTAGGNGGASRMQLSNSSRLTGFRKYLGLRWIEYFLFPGEETEFSLGVAPSTVIAALRLLCALLGNARYEAVFKKEGYYRLLAQGLPCNHAVFSHLAVEEDLRRFPFQKMWYALFGALLGTPIDGMSLEIRFESEYLCRDFEANIQRDRVINSSMLIVIMILLRRHYNDPVAMVSTMGDLAAEDLSTIPATVVNEEYGCGDHSDVNPAKAAPILPTDQGDLYHIEVLDFLQQIFEKMPSLPSLFISGGEKMRLEFMEELTRLIFAAARTYLVQQYPHTQEHITIVLQTKQVAVNEYNIAVGEAELAEEAAATDSSGKDPFLHHAVAARGLRLLITLLMKFLLDAPNGQDLVEEFIDGTANASVVLPPLHNGLLLRFQSLVVMGLLDHIRAKFADEEILAKHKRFGVNVREFVKFVVGKMHCWQRAQHGDGCPAVIACCGQAHFVGGPSRLLELVLFILAEANAGLAGSNGTGSFPPPAPLTLGGILSETLSKGKKRRPLRQLMGRMTRSTELENLFSELYSALNAVVLHVFHGRGAEVGDVELEAMLQQIHLHREVVLDSQNNQDKIFLTCFCRYLLQLLADSNVCSLQEVAALLWVDLILLQRTFMDNLLTVEIRKSGAPPYSVNLMKNGFDVLFECTPRSKGPQGSGIVLSPSFVKFLKWLELVGPPLKELESNLDRVYINAVMENKENVHELWTVYHKKATHRKNKYEKQFDARCDWLVSMENEYIESLLRTQQTEFRRQLKWRQDRVDRQKFIARQWGKLRLEFERNAFGSPAERRSKRSGAENASVAIGSSVLMTEVTNRSRYELMSATFHQYSWRLDFTEGPYRMRKRLSRIVPSPETVQTLSGQLSSPSRLYGTSASLQTRISSPREASSDLQLPRRRNSESDAIFDASRSRVKSATIKHRMARQRSDESVSAKHHLIATKKALSSGASASAVLSSREHLRKGSFESLFNKYVKKERRPSRRESWRFRRLSTRQDSIPNGDESDGEKEEVGAGENTGVENSAVTESAASTSNVAMEEVVDEKLRPLLVPGDEISNIYDCLRIDGMDSCPGVFLLCNDHVYIIDNYQRLDQQFSSPPGTVENDFAQQSSQIRVTEVPLGSTTLLERRLSWRLEESPEHIHQAVTRSKDIHQCRFWAYEDITELHKRRYQLRHVALEIFANDGRNYLVTLETPEQRELVFHALLSKCPNVQGAASGLDGVSSGGDLYSQLRKLLRNTMTERWVQGDISNFAYLMHLNTLAGRSYNDLTQYPVFPWVIADYDSEVLDLSDPGVYRDLSKPMGAIRREEEFRARYEGLMESVGAIDGDESADNPLGSRPFHYGTHYSSAAITLHYLMRLEPFTSHFRRLHGGKYDHADRLFTSIVGAWKSAAGFEGAQNGTQDVKELIPEFFYLPEFLENVNERVFGTSQTGVVVGDVELPPWANGSPTEFVRMNRAALESPYVSANLHHWIDLIFGFKQQGPAAVEACNVFYHLTYEGSVDLDAITEPSTKRAILDQITEFGQTPSQLFRTPHPVRAASAVPVTSNNSFFGGSLGPLSGSTSSQMGSSLSTNIGTDNSRAAASPVTARAALASSFLEGGEIITRMQTMLSGGSGISGTFVGATEAIPSPVLENAALLKQEVRRQVPVNLLLAFYRRGQQSSSSAQSSSTSIRHIAWSSGGVGREDRVAAVGAKCLLIPPRNNEYLAWGFQDRSVKFITAGSTDIGGHGADSKVITSLELDVDIDVATITTDGRIVITSCPGFPVLRMWKFNSSRRSLAASIAAGTSSASGTSSSAAAVATSLAAASSLSGPHRRRTYATIGASSTRSLTLIGTVGTPAHCQRITALQASRAYSILVSGCAGGVASLWDLNRRRFIRQLPSIDGQNAITGGRARSITAICINEVTGDIIVAAGSTFGVYNVNGTLRVRLDDSVVIFQDPTALSPVSITSLAVNRGESCEWGAEKHVVTGHADGTLCVWAYSQAGARDQNPRSRKKDEWMIELQGRHKVTPNSAITALCITPDKRKLFTGTQDGQLSVWTATLSNSSPTSSVHR